MSASRERHRTALSPRASRSLLAFLVVALAVGVAATYLAAPPPGAAPAASGELPLSAPLTLQTLGWVLLGLLIVPFAFLALYRARVRSSFADHRVFLNLLLIAMLAIAFLVIARSISYGATPAGNNTGPPPNNLPNGTSLPPGSNLSPPIVGPTPLIPGVPGWLGYAGLIAIIAVAVVVVVYRMRPEPSPGGVEEARSAVRARLHKALSELSQGGETDPRQVVIALYADLLERIGPNLEQLDAATPREIALESVTKLGIQRDHAGTLTGLFEEARYSTHPFTSERVAEARAALAGAIADLARPREARP